MDAIKKKMQAMKLEKDNAADKADAMEGQAKDANMRAEKVNYRKKKVFIELKFINYFEFNVNRSRKKYKICKGSSLKLKAILLQTRINWNKPINFLKTKKKHSPT